MPTPENFDVLGLLEQLESCQLRYNIGVDHSSGSSYTLHLANCFRTMSRICKIRGLEVCTLDDLVNNKVLGSSDWLLCIKDCNTAVSIIVSRSSFLTLYGDNVFAS